MLRPRAPWPGAAEEKSAAVPTLTILRLGFSVLWIVVFVYTAWESRRFPAIAGWFPMVVSFFGIGLAVATLTIDVAKWRREGDTVGQDAAATASTAAFGGEGGAGVPRAFALAGRYGLWLLAYTGLIWLVGAVAGSALFVFLFLLLEARASWPYLVAGPIVTIAGLTLLAEAVNLFWPRSLLTLIG